MMNNRTTLYLETLIEKKSKRNHFIVLFIKNFQTRMKHKLVKEILAEMRNITLKL